MAIVACAGASAGPMAIAAPPWRDSTEIESHTNNRKNRRVMLRSYRKSGACIKALRCMRIPVHAHAPSRGADACAALQACGGVAGSKLC